MNRFSGATIRVRSDRNRFHTIKAIHVVTIG